MHHAPTRAAGLAPQPLRALALASLLSLPLLAHAADNASATAASASQQPSVPQPTASSTSSPQMQASAFEQARERFAQGVIATEQKKYPEAIQIFNALIKDFPNLPEPYNNLAVLYASQGDLVQAASLLQQAVRIDPYYASGYENLGDMYTLLANEAYNKAVSLDEMRTGLPAKLAMIQQIFPDGRTSIAHTQQKAPAAASAQPASPAAAQPQQHSPHALSIAVEHAVKDWADAWASQNLARYFAAYSEQFKPLKGSLAAWKAERRARIEDKGFIKVDISDLKVQIQGNRATATFRQRYTADNYQSNDRKTLELQREGDKWLITREFTSP